MTKQAHKQDLLELKAPQAGVVKDLATHTTGTVVQPGTVLLTLVPQDEILRAEVWVSNEDIGFVRQGQPVKLKFAAFPFQKYGMVDGTVEHVSADAADNNTGNGNTQTDSSKKNQLLYKALVALKQMNLRASALGLHKLIWHSGRQKFVNLQWFMASTCKHLRNPVYSRLLGSAKDDERKRSSLKAVSVGG